MSSERLWMAIRGLAYFSYGAVFCSRLGFWMFKYMHSNRVFQHPEQVTQALAGQHIVVTGANSGIGLEASKLMLKHGAHVHMICRDINRGQAAVNDFLKQYSQCRNQISLHQVDVSDLRQVKRFQTEVQGIKFFAVVHNAGCMVHDYKLTAQNLEINSATNIVGPYLMTKLLLETGSLGRGSTVVFVTSGGMYTSKLRPSIAEIQAVDPEMRGSRFSGLNQYARNKRQQVVLTEVLAKSSPDSGVEYYSWHPGWADTKALRESMATFRKVSYLIIRDPVESAYGLIDLLSAPSSELTPGGCYFDGRQTFKHIPCTGTEHRESDVQQLMRSLEALSKQ